MVGTRLLILVASAAAVMASAASAMAPAAAGATDVAVQFVTAANRGDFRTVCRLYSARYVKSQASCVSLYRWGAGLYGPFDYSDRSLAHAEERAPARRSHTLARTILHRARP